MASNSSKTYQNPQKNAGEITQEELFAFHNIDRQLFIRLAFNLKCDASQAMQAIAFWLWLERLNMAQYIAIIVRFPDLVFEALFKETFLCLKSVESEEVVVHQNIDVPMVQRIVGVHRKEINLKFFKDNRDHILLGLRNIVQQICLRAFHDLIQIVLSSKKANIQGDNYNINEFHSLQSSPPSVRAGPSIDVIGDDGYGGGISSFKSTPTWPTPISPFKTVSYPIYEHNLGDENKGVFVPHPHVSNPNFLQGGGASLSNNVPMPLVNAVGNNFIVETHPQILQGDLNAQFLAQMRKDEEKNIPASERTIFLTFSKGYPIHEVELREFFNRSFGDIIEALYMQEVGANEQPLYARLVVRNTSAIVAILSEYGKSKFAINGKHVWARKYVHKSNLNSPPSSPPSN